MKFVYVLALVAAVHGSVVKREVELSAPRGVANTILGDGAVKTSWDEVKNEDEKDPIAGYKLMMWELTPRKAIITKYSLVNYTGHHTIEIDVIPPVDSTKTPEGKLTEILTSPFETTAVTEPLKPGATYEFRVLAFTKSSEGPMSMPIRVKITK